MKLVFVKLFLWANSVANFRRSVSWGGHKTQDKPEEWQGDMFLLTVFCTVCQPSKHLEQARNSEGKVFEKYNETAKKNNRMQLRKTTGQLSALWFIPTTLISQS